MEVNLTYEGGYTSANIGPDALYNVGLSIGETSKSNEGDYSSYLK